MLFSRDFRAIREDEVSAAALGKNVVSFEVRFFAIGAVIAAVGGSLYAYYTTFIDPAGFTVMESIFVISIAIVVGAGNLRV